MKKIWKKQMNIDNLKIKIIIFYLLIQKRYHSIKLYSYIPSEWRCFKCARSAIKN